MIKRIVGRPGDVIAMDDEGHLTRNGTAVKESEVIYGSQWGDAGAASPCTVPEGRYFYLGDNRPVSLDSRVLGTAGAENILGKVICVIRFGC